MKIGSWDSKRWGTLFLVVGLASILCNLVLLAIGKANPEIIGDINTTRNVFEKLFGFSVGFTALGFVSGLALLVMYLMKKDRSKSVAWAVLFAVLTIELVYWMLSRHMSIIELVIYSIFLLVFLSVLIFFIGKSFTIFWEKLTPNDSPLNQGMTFIISSFSLIISLLTLLLK